MGEPIATEKPRPTGLRLTPQANRALKIMAATEGISKQEYLERLIRRECAVAEIPERSAQSRPA